VETACSADNGKFITRRVRETFPPLSLIKRLVDRVSRDA